MEQLVKHVSAEYYLGIISASIAFIFCFISKKGVANLKIYKLIPIYLGTYAIIKVVCYLLPVFTGFSMLAAYTIPIILDFIFTVIEYLYFLYFIQIVKGNRKWLYLFQKWIFLAIVISLLISDIFLDRVLQFQTLYTVYSIQAIFLIIAGVDYMYKSLIVRDQFNLSDPDNMIIVGILLFMLCTLPISLFLNFLLGRSLELTQNLFSIFYGFYIILFVILYKAHQKSVNRSEVRKFPFSNSLEFKTLKGTTLN